MGSNLGNKGIYIIHWEASRGEVLPAQCTRDAAGMQSVQLQRGTLLARLAALGQSLRTLAPRILISCQDPALQSPHKRYCSFFMGCLFSPV